MIRGGSLRRRRARALVLVILAAAALGVVFYATGLLGALEAQSVDARFSVRGTQPSPDDIVIVGVNDQTFNELENHRWPFPRSLEGRVIETLHRDGAKAIGVDIQFTEQSTPKQDNALIEAVVGAPGVVLSTTEVNQRGESRIFGGEEVVHEIHARAGNTQVPIESGGTTRKMLYEFGGLTSFPVATAEATTGSPVSASEFEADGKAWIDFRGPPGTFREVSFSRVLRGKIPASAFRGKTVIIGATAPSLQDQHATSTTGDELMSGPELQASSVWTALHGFPLSSSGTVVDLILILLFAFAPAAATLRVRPLLSLLGAIGLGLLYAVVVQLAFDGGTVLPFVYPLLALVVSALGALAVNYLLTSFERQRVRDTFARFVPEAVVADVLDRVDEEDLRFGGVRRECTVLFSDLRGFTSFAEELEPERVIEVLNRYLEAMSDAIMEQSGTLVAFMGDGIMAVFGAPVEHEDHADRALAAAREMLRVRLPAFNEWLRGKGLGEGFAMGIGINSGTVMSGQVGSERRIEYTAIGDTTNTAARLEGMTKGSGHEVFVADSTKVALRGDEVVLEIVGEREVRGRAHTITVWTLR
jgi:adenylate cyclase